MVTKEKMHLCVSIRFGDKP